MSTTIKLKRSAVPGRIPTVSQLELGEVAINTNDGKLYFKKYHIASNTESIVDISADLNANSILTLLSTVDGANSGLDADLLDGQHGSYYLDYNNFSNVPPASLDLTLSGKVTGTGFSNTGTLVISTELANTGVTPGTYGTSSQIPIFTVDEDGRITAASNTAVAGVDDFFFTDANNTLTIQTGDGSKFNAKIAKLDRIEEDLTIQLNGDVTGTVTSNTGVMSVTTDIANTGVSAGTYGSASQIPIVTVGLDGRITSMSNTAVAGVDAIDWYSANSTFAVTTGDGSVFRQKINEFNEVKINETTSHTALRLGNIDGATSANLDITLDSGTNSYARYTLNTSGPTGYHYFYAPNISSPLFVVGSATNGASQTVQTNSDFIVSTNRLIKFQGSVQDSIFTRLQVDNPTQERYITLPNATGTVAVSVSDTAGQQGIDLTLSSAGNISGVASGLDANSSPTFAALNLDGNLVFNNGSFTTTITPDTATANRILTLPDATGTVLTTGNAQDVLDTLITVDGAGSGLDADKLDGYDAAGILDQAANTASSLVGNGLVTITANNGLTGTGSFNLNSANNFTISVEHGDTSSVQDVSVTLPNIINEITFDGFGHVQSVSNTDITTYLDTRYYTETETDTLLSAKVDKTTQVIAGNGLTGGGALSGDVTLNHQDTSTASSVNNAGGTVIQDLNIDTYGHVTSIGSYNLDGRYYTETELNNGQLDSRYYTETELDNGALDPRYFTKAQANANFVDVTGDTMSGDLIVNADIYQSYSRTISTEVNASTTFPTPILQFPHADWGSAEVIVTVKDGSNRHVTKLLITHNGSTAIATEYGVIYTSSELATFDVSISGSNVGLVAVSASGSSNYKIVATLLKS